MHLKSLGAGTMVYVYFVPLLILLKNKVCCSFTWRDPLIDCTLLEDSVCLSLEVTANKN